MAGGYGGFKEEQTLPALYVSDTRGRFLKLTPHRHDTLVHSLFATFFFFVLILPNNIFSSTLTNSLFTFSGTYFNTSIISALVSVFILGGAVPCQPAR